MSVAAKWTGIVSFLLATTGTVTNSLSLSYFIKKEKVGLTARLFIMLNITELTQSIVGSLMGPIMMVPYAKGTTWFILRELAKDFNIFMTYNSIWCFLCICTTRAIKVCAPFHRIKPRNTILVSACFCICNIASLALYILTYTLPSFRDDPVFQRNFLRGKLLLALITNVIMYIVVIGTALAITKTLLTKTLAAELQNRNKQAAGTVLILSAFFVLCYFPTFILMCFKLNDLDLEVWELKEGSHWLVALGTALSMLLYPINATFDPLIYFIRKKEMREFFSNAVKSIKLPSYKE